MHQLLRTPALLSSAREIAASCCGDGDKASKDPAIFEWIVVGELALIIFFLLFIAAK